MKSKYRYNCYMLKLCWWELRQSFFSSSVKRQYPSPSFIPFFSGWYLYLNYVIIPKFLGKWMRNVRLNGFCRSKKTFLLVAIPSDFLWWRMKSRSAKKCLCITATHHKQIFVCLRKKQKICQKQNVGQWENIPFPCAILSIIFVLQFYNYCVAHTFFMASVFL